jgi:predicted transcriptional regulator
MDLRDQIILDFIKLKGACSSKEVYENTELSISYATLKRIISKLLKENYLTSIGQGKGTKYFISSTYKLLESIDIEKYYEKEIDEREIQEVFNFYIINEVFANNDIFTENELEKLNSIQLKFQHNISQ